MRKTIDVIIGTCCIHNNFSLHHNDKGFESLEEYLKLNKINI